MNPSPFNPPPLPRSWWSRNWKWAVPVFVGVPVLICGGIATLVVSLVFGLLKDSEPYKTGLAAARQNSEVRAVLGEPIQPAYFFSGNISLNGSSGSANMTVPLSGPKGSATLNIVGTKSGDVWTYSVLTVAPAGGGKPIDLHGQLKP